MRAIPEEMAGRIAGGAATLCTVWIVTRADGERLGFTDHDRPLAVDGVACAAASGWTPGRAEVRTGLEPGSSTAAGVLDAEAVRETDILAGLWDGAMVDTWRVDWSDPGLRVRLRRERVVRLVREGEVFTAETEGPMAALDRVIGRTYGRGCDAALGDARCGVDLAAFPGESCDKRWATCQAVFANGDRFRGFPDIPGDDFLTVYPRAGEVADGGRRR